MRRRVESQARYFGVRHGLRRFKNIGGNHYRRMERHVSDGQYAGGLRRSHCFAAIVTLIGWIARHGAAALHTLRVLRHRRHAVRELQAQQSDQRQDDEQSITHCPKFDSKQIRRLSQRKDTHSSVGWILAGATGLEPATSCVTGRRSNQLNYAPASYDRLVPSGSIRDLIDPCRSLWPCRDRAAL
jgi:hypothetical protein